MEPPPPRSRKKVWSRERLLRPIEVGLEGQVDRRRFGAIQENFHVTGLGGRRPDSPDAAGSLDFGEHLLTALLTPDARAIAVRLPANVAIVGGIVAARPVVTRGQFHPLARNHRRRESLQIGYPAHEIAIRERLRAARREGQGCPQESEGRETDRVVQAN